MSQRAKLLVGGLAGIALVLGAYLVSGASHRFAAIPGDDMKHLLERRAGDLAAQNGGNIPTTAEVVLTKRQESQDLVAGGDEVGSNEPVYLVQMEGSFVVNAAPIPSGAEAPTGSTLWFLVDAESGQSLDWGLGLKPEDLSKLGEVSQITPIPPSGGG